MFMRYSVKLSPSRYGLSGIHITALKSRELGSNTSDAVTPKSREAHLTPKLCTLDFSSKDAASYLLTNGLESEAFSSGGFTSSLFTLQLPQHNNATIRMMVIANQAT
ncbi:unnamed protein product [Albugo candida]|uniref:Uncharacterized protein n=1 Tax=Albugo candida TaxID=65357 RepID=A0A024FWU2_9STRA|nr:unnamed protein product [Albugo candida]|eukprot:CCI11471.1 unnamed protein product [Albugo candida]